MALFAILIPTTILVVIGYFVLTASARSDGGLKTFGKYLSIWIFALAALLVLGAATAPIFGWRHFGMHGMMMRGQGAPGMMHGPGMGGGMMNRPDMMPAPSPAVPAEAAPQPQEVPSKQ